MTLPVDTPLVCPVLVGRSVHIEAMRRLADRARTGAGGAILLSGEAGTGKSRLAADMRDWAMDDGWRVLVAACDEADRGRPYAPIYDLLQRVPATDATGVAAKLQEVGQERSQLLYATAGLFERLAADRPLLLIVEDLHWCDDASLDLLFYLARRLVRERVLLLLTYRSDETFGDLGDFLAKLDQQRLATEMSLAKLSRTEVDQMVRAIFDQPRPLRAEFLEQLYQLSEGNPFFVEEILRAMVRSGDIYFDQGIWDRKPLAELHIPRSVQELMRRRREELSPVARQVLTTAAVAGRRPDFALLHRLVDLDEAQLIGALKELIGAQLLVEESADRFAFRHALIQEAAQANLLARERRAMHRVVAGVLEQQAIETGETPLADLAYHAFLGEDWAKALDYSGRAGRQALALHAPHTAVSHFNHALQSADALRQPAPVSVLLARGDAFMRLSEYDAALTDYKRALDAAKRDGDEELAWRATLGLGHLWATRDYERSGDYIADALSQARRHGVPQRLASSLNQMGNWRMNREQPFAALRDHEEALAIFAGLKDQTGLAETLDLLAITRFNCGDLIGGRSDCRRAITLWEAVDDPRGLLMSQSGLALAADFELEFDNEAVADNMPAGRQAVETARSITWRSGEALATICLGLAEGRRGQWGAAREILQAALDAAIDIEHKEWIVDARRGLGWLHSEFLDFERAEQILLPAQDMACEINSEIWQRQTAAALATALMRQDRPDEAQAALDAVLAVDGPARTLQERLIWASRAELALARGQDELALEIIERLIAAAQNLAVAGRVVPRLWWLRGEALLGLECFGEAEAALRDALVVAQAQGRLPLQWRIELALGRTLLAQRRRTDAEEAFNAARASVETLAATLPDDACADGGPTLRAQFLERSATRFPPLPAASPRQTAKERYGGLTSREREVAILVAQGLSNRDIAGRLTISERTAERHVANIMLKLDFNARTQIAAWAVERGLLAESG